MISGEKLSFLRKGVISIVREVIDPLFLSDSLEIQRKSDSSIVTRVDKEISDFAHGALKFLIDDAGFYFFSEEDQQSFNFPCIILDPIDGTRELSQGLGECVVSLAVMSSTSEGFAWLFNPFTGFELSTASEFVVPASYNSEKLFGYVSRGDAKEGRFDGLENSTEISFAPRGSIAFKLGLLSSGACDFVFSKTPKNVWDIAAGTLLCWQRGYQLFQNGKEIKAMDQLMFEGELLWCRKENLEKLNVSLVNNP